MKALIGPFQIRFPPFLFYIVFVQSIYLIKIQKEFFLIDKLTVKSIYGIFAKPPKMDILFRQTKGIP